MQSKNRSAYPPPIQRPVAVKIHHRDKTYACEAIAFLPFLLPSFPPNPPTPPLIFLPKRFRDFDGGIRRGEDNTLFREKAPSFSLKRTRHLPPTLTLPMNWGGKENTQ